MAEGRQSTGGSPTQARQDVEYLELAARTSGFRAGAPHSVGVSDDGATVVFLRSAGPDGRSDYLWAFDVSTGQERELYSHGGGVRGYAMAGTGAAASVAAVVDDQLVVLGLDGSRARAFTAAAPVTDPRPDPTGRRVGYVVGQGLHVLDRATGQSALLAGETDSPGVSWGRPDPLADHFGQDRGYWWSPDGTSVLALRIDASRVPARGEARVALAGEANAEVSLHLLDLDGGWVDVHWDRETYPYLASVSWSDVGGPLVTVLRRLQQHGLVLAVDPRTGETQVHAELADPRWVGPVPASPVYLPDGRVLIGGELAHDGYDARCLFADGGLLTPPSLYVRRVCGRLGLDVLVEASEGEPSEQHLYRVAARSVAAPTEVTRLTADAGWHAAACAAETVAIGSSSLDHDGTQWTVMSRGVVVGGLRSFAAAAPFAPRPSLERVTDRSLPAAVLYPRVHAGGRLPVLVDIVGTPGRQEVIASRAGFLPRQWWADQGFAVVVINGRGTPGLAPSYEKAIHRRVADVLLTDQCDALAALADKHPDLDLHRVALRGCQFGGWLAALSVLRRPELYRCAIAIEPITAWDRLPTACAERYLGLPSDAADLYAHHSLIEAAAEPPRRRDESRPILVVAASDPSESTVDVLTTALDGASRPYERLATDDVTAELAFLRTALA